MLSGCMYSQHFGLNQDPFSIAPDPRYLYMSARHREALAHLLFGVAGPDKGASGTGGGFVLLTGDIGTGKTTICRCFLEQIPPGCHVAYIFNPKLTVIELLQSICEEFHIALAPVSTQAPTVKTYIDALNAFLLQSHAAGHSCVLIIDEAQNLQSDVLEQLRLLTNLETSARKLLQIVLIGQPELRARLARPRLEQLAQRVIARFHLDALNVEESTHYIAHRLAVAGHKGPLPFDKKALQHIHRLTRGVPRRINLLCGRALLGAWANGLERVTAKVVDAAATEVFGSPNIAPARPGRISSRLWNAIALLSFATLAAYSVYVWQKTKKHGPPGTIHAQRAVPSPVLTTGPSQIPPASSATGASAPMATALEQSAKPPPLPAIDSLEALLSQLTTDADVAWNALATHGRFKVEPTQPCSTAAGGDPLLQCYRTTSLTLPQLRQLGRPGILTLHAEGLPPLFAVLVGMTEQNATLQLAKGPHTVNLIALGRLWQGDFATYWRAPPGYERVARGGSTGAAIAELARGLALLDGTPSPQRGLQTQTLDANLQARILDFQRAQGLKADGQPGPMTYMQLESALGIQQPRFITAQPPTSP